VAAADDVQGLCKELFPILRTVDLLRKYVAERLRGRRPRQRCLHQKAGDGTDVVGQSSLDVAKERKSNTGRKQLVVVSMLKALILLSFYYLADQQVEYQIRDRLSFPRFLGLGIEDEVPDATTVWRFREPLKELGLLEALFDRSGDDLSGEGFQAKRGQIVDASIVPVPIQLNSRKENRRIKDGEVPENWSEAKREQKDVQARWTQKNGKSVFGHKNDIDVDAEHKLIRTFAVTPANVHDSQVLDDLIDPDNEDPGVCADAAYRNEETETVLADAGYGSHICEKGQAGQPLTAEQQGQNRRRSKTRSRVEHVFGFQQYSMGGKRVRTIGLARAEVTIGLMNLTYNLMRYLQLTKHREGAPVAA
jgi:transposase, IS5 family